MLQIAPQMKILVAFGPADFRRGIDGVARLCQQHSLRASVGLTTLRSRVRQRTGPTRRCKFRG
jgi:hypothetical protein